MVKVNFGNLRITSPVFEHGGEIPAKYAGDGTGNPPLRWENAPDGTESFVLLAEDPDAPVLGGISHWVVYGIPADVTSLNESDERTFIAGTNGVGGTEWIPPGPPPGHGAHFYYFHLFALSGGVELPPGLSRDELLPLIHDSVIEQARIVGWFAN